MTDWWSIKEYPYEVWHPESENGTAKFRTWKDALASQKVWNKDCPGHVARKRKIELTADVQFETCGCAVLHHKGARMSGQLKRRVTTDETLTLAACPDCSGEIGVGDCGYGSFNPGWAKCKSCKREWKFACVDDSWHVGNLWNERAKKIRDRLRVFAEIAVKEPALRIGRNFAEEDLAAEAAILLDTFREMIVADATSESKGEKDVGR